MYCSYLSVCPVGTTGNFISYLPDLISTLYCRSFDELMIFILPQVNVYPIPGLVNLLA